MSAPPACPEAGAPPGGARARRARTAAPRVAAVPGRAAALALVAALALAAPAAAARAPELSRTAADRLLLERESGARDRTVLDWAKHAAADEVLWLLRHDPAQLGALERDLVELALDRVPDRLADLRHQLELRRALLDPHATRKAGLVADDLERLRPRASVWRVALLLPDRGDYAGYAAQVRAAVAAGLASGRPPGALPIELDVHGTGDAEPARVAAAYDSASRVCAATVGELLSVPTFALAAAARVLEQPVISPTATDEAIGASGPTIFAVGPTDAQRAEALARAMLPGRGRKLAIVATPVAGRGAFVAAFAAAAESLGARIVRRETVVPGGDAHAAVVSIKTAAPEVLLWDGDARDAEPFVRELATEGVSVRLCGGEALDPEQFHAGARALLEGVTYVGGDWRLPPPAQAHLDSLAARSGNRAGPLWVRGWLAGRRIAAAVDAGARTPAQVAAGLRAHDPRLRAAGGLDCALEGATLPVERIVRGRPVDAATADAAH